MLTSVFTIKVILVTTHRGITASLINLVFVTGCRVLYISASRPAQHIGSYVSQADRGEIKCPVSGYAVYFIEIASSLPIL